MTTFSIPRQIDEALTAEAELNHRSRNKQLVVILEAHYASARHDVEEREVKK